MSLVGLSSKKKEELKGKMLSFRKESEAGNQGTFRRMTIAEHFKVGHQWQRTDIAFNESRGKISATINECLPVVLDLVGTQTRNPNDIIARNVKGGTQKAAEIISSLIKNVMDKSDGDDEKSEAFENGVTTGRGWLGLERDFTNDPSNGELIITKKDPFSIGTDPAAKAYDYNDSKNGGKFLYEDNWIDKEKVEATYPSKKAEIKQANFNLFSDTTRFPAIMNIMFSNSDPFGTTDDYRDGDVGIGEDLRSTRHRHNYRVTTYWWRKWVKGIYIQRLDIPFAFLAVHKPKEIAAAKKFAEDNDLVKILDKDNEGKPLTIPLMNKTVMVGDVLVDHTEDPHNGMHLFPLFRYAPYFDNGYEYGIVENLIGRQEILNIFASSRANLTKQLANSGWIGADIGEKKREELEQMGGEDGIILSEKDYGGSIRKIVPNAFPVAQDLEVVRAKEDIREVSQVATEEVRGDRQSGKALQIKEAQNLKTQGVPFRNWQRTLRIVGNTIMGMVQTTDVFSDEEIRAIVDEEKLIDPAMLQQARQLVIDQFKGQGTELPEPPTPPDPQLLELATPEVRTWHIQLSLNRLLLALFVLLRFPGLQVSLCRSL